MNHQPLINENYHRMETQLQEIKNILNSEYSAEQKNRMINRILEGVEK